MEIDKMNYTDNMRVEFNLVIDEHRDFVTTEDIINKPIVVGSVPIGIITEANLDESGLIYVCKGVIWDRFIEVDFTSELQFNSIRLL